MSQPNIIFYFADQQRWDTVNSVVMPKLCSMESDATFFDSTFTCQPVCGPARACLQTGLYATQCGCYWNGIPLPSNIKSLASYFSDAGYKTAYVGKWHLASDRIPGKGFHCERSPVPAEKRGGYKDYWRAADVLEFTSHGYGGYVFGDNGERYDFDGYRADEINNFAVDFVNKTDSSEPFFLFVSQLEPHHQNDHGHFEGRADTIESFKDYPLPDDLTFLDGNYEREYPDYLSAINALDDNFARLAAAVKENGMWDNTVIIYTADHGCHFKTRNLEYKRCCHDSCTHIPLIIIGGAFRGGGVDSRLVSLIDLPPTLLDIAGIDIPESYIGRSLADKDNERDCVFIQISESQVGRAIRTKNYKYSVRAGLLGVVFHSSLVYFEDFLYDLREDPNEKHNLVKDERYAGVRAQLRVKLVREMLNAGERKPIILPAMCLVASKGDKNEKN